MWRFLILTVLKDFKAMSRGPQWLVLCQTVRMWHYRGLLIFWNTQNISKLIIRLKCDLLAATCMSKGVSCNHNDYQAWHKSTTCLCLSDAVGPNPAVKARFGHGSTWTQPGLTTKIISSKMKGENSCNEHSSSLYDVQYTCFGTSYFLEDALTNICFDV